MIDELIRSKRKTLSIQIARDGKLVVRAPQRLSRREINAFITAKQHWIKTKQKAAKLIQDELATQTYESGSLFWFNGERYPLVISDNTNESHSSLSFENKQFILNQLLQSNAYEQFYQWYWQQTHRYINKQLPYFSELHQLDYDRFKITRANARWGSCNVKKQLNFSWRLSMTPDFVKDYIIYHELAHTIHFNHSAKFWALVANISPDYKAAEKWLSENNRYLNLTKLS